MPTSHPVHPYICVGHRVIVRDDAFEEEDTSFRVIRGYKGTVVSIWGRSFRVMLDNPVGALKEPGLYHFEIELLNVPENCENCQ